MLDSDYLNNLMYVLDQPNTLDYESLMHILSVVITSNDSKREESNFIYLLLRLW